MDELRITHEIRWNGTLFYLLNALIGAYNRRTDVMLRTAETDPKVIAELTARIRSSTNAIQTALDNANKSQKET